MNPSRKSVYLRLAKKQARYSYDGIRDEVDPAYFYNCELGIKLDTSRDWQAAGLCPFHDDHHAGSFRVSLRSGAFFCHACQASGGSVIDFLKERYRISFREAVQRLRKDWLLS
jgi:DNA primase